MKNYINLINEILLKGEQTEDRTGVGTTSIFGTRLEFDLRKGFPAVTTKKLFWEGVVAELLWFLEGSTNVYRLSEIQHGNRDTPNIWTSNYNKQAVGMGYSGGELGPVYGEQFHNENQLNNFITGLRSNPSGRRHIISLWNPSEIDDMALPPCHGLAIQGFINANNELSIQWYQRSVDSFLGLPYNIASYALFTHIIAQIVGCNVGKLIFVGGDTHIYSNHTNQCGELVTRKPYDLPTLEIPSFTSLEDCLLYGVKDFKLVNYKHHESIRAPMAV
jgi:thymidylate synthase